METALHELQEQVMQAVYPEDLFGSHEVVLPVDALLEYLQRRYDDMAAICNPARYQNPDDIDVASDTQRTLERLYKVGQERIRERIYGMPGRGKARPNYAARNFTIGRNRYFLGHELGQAFGVTTYEGFLERDRESVGEVEIRVAQNSDANRLLQNEVRILGLLHEQAVPQWKHLPLMMDRFHAGERVGVVLRKFSGLSLAEIRGLPRYQSGIDQRHMVWMLDRILSCLGYVHRCGIVHTALTPEQFIVDAASHNVYLQGWGNAVHTPALSLERSRAEPTEFTAPEVLNSGALGPWSDIYSVGKIMMWLLGGNTATNELPATVEPTIAEYLQTMLHSDPYKRPTDAWELHAQEVRIKDALWTRTFLPFDVT